MAAYLKGDPVDRIPCHLNIFETTAPNYGIPMDEYYFSSDKMVFVEEANAKRYGVDNMGLGIGLRGMAEAMGTTVGYASDRICFVEKSFLTDYTMLDQIDVGTLHKKGRIPIVLEALKVLVDRHADAYSVGVGMAGPFSAAAAVRGTNRFLKDILRHPEDAGRLLKKTAEGIKALAEVIYRECGVVIGLSEPMISADMLGLKQVEVFGLPYLKEVCEYVLKLTGRRPSLHICGAISDRIKELMTLPISSLSVDNCEDMAALAPKMNGRIMLMGNVHPVNALLLGTKRDVEREIRKSLMDGSGYPGGFILAPGCQVPIGTPAENLDHFMRCAEYYGKGAVRGKRIEAEEMPYLI